MIQTATEFIKIYGPWIVVVLGFLFLPTFYGLMVQLVGEAEKKTNPVPRKRSRTLDPYGANTMEVRVERDNQGRLVRREIFRTGNGKRETRAVLRTSGGR